MLKVSIGVHSGAARFDVAVQAESVERAIDLVRGRYNAGDVRVRSVAASFGFLEEDRAPRTDAVAGIKGISEEDYLGLIAPIAPAFAGLPGLVSKTWLSNAETNTYGGVYVWSDRGAMEAYKQTDIYKRMRANPHFDNVTVTDFAVVEGATRVTRGPVEVAA